MSHDARANSLSAELPQSSLHHVHLTFACVLVYLSIPQWLSPPRSTRRCRRDCQCCSRHASRCRLICRAHSPRSRRTATSHRRATGRLSPWRAHAAVCRVSSSRPASSRRPKITTSSMRPPQTVQEPHVGSHGRIHIACIRRITSRQSRADLMADLRTFAAPPSAPEGMRLRLSPECESVGDAVTDRPRGGRAPSTWLAGI